MGVRRDGRKGRVKGLLSVRVEGCKGEGIFVIKGEEGIGELGGCGGVGDINRRRE